MVEDATTKDTSSRDIDAAANAIQILRHPTHADGPQDVAIITRATGISPSGVFNILRILGNERLTSSDGADKTYQLGLGLSGPAVGFVGCDYVDLIQSGLGRLSLARHILIALWQVTGDAHIRVIALATLPIAHVNVVAGIRLSELVSAAGHRIADLRELPEDELHCRLTRVRQENPSSFERYRAEAAEVVGCNWAIDQEHLCRGVSMVIGAITDRDGQPRFTILTIDISAQHQPDDPEQIGINL